jgi:hypothetical protein
MLTVSGIFSDGGRGLAVLAWKEFAFSRVGE